MLASTMLMAGCVASVAQDHQLSDAFTGSRVERIDRPEGLPIGDLDVEVWQAPSQNGRIYIYAPRGDTSTCYVSVFDASVADVAPAVRALLTSADSPFVEGAIERVEGTGAAQIIYTSSHASLPLVLSLIANAGADSSVPSVQLALKRIR